MSHLFTSESIISFLILVILEIVLGIDNIVFISILAGRLPDDQYSSSQVPLVDLVQAFSCARLNRGEPSRKMM